MLESEVGDVIAERVEEVIIAVMMRAEKFLRLIDQTLIAIPDFWRDVERSGAVGRDIHFSGRIFCQGNDFQEFSGNYRRVDESRKRSRRKMNVVAALAGDRKRCAELPA